MLSRIDVRRVDDELRQSAAKTIVHALGKIEAMRRAEQVKVSRVIPLTHDGETVEQRNVVLLRHHAHIIQVGRDRNHRFRTRAILHIHQNDVGACILQRGNPIIDGDAKIVGIDRSHSIDGAGLPDNQSRLLGFHKLNEAGGGFLSGLLDL